MEWFDVLRLVVAIVIVLSLMGLVYLAFRGKKKSYRIAALKILLGLCAEAEKEFGAKTGVIKQSVVFRSIYNAMPSLFRMFFSQEEVLALIEEALATLEDFLEKNSEAAKSIQ